MARGKLVNRKFIFIIIIIAGLGLMYLPGYSKLQKLKERDRRLQTEISELSRQNLTLAEELTKLKNDPIYAEYVARREMGFAKEGEIIYRVVEDEDITADEE